MEIPKFSGDKDEIGPKEWFQMVKEYYKFPFFSRYNLYGDTNVWWYSLPNDVRRNCTWDEYEKIFLNRWIEVKNMEDMQTIKEKRVEYKNEWSKVKNYNEELKQYLKNNVDQVSNMQSLNEEHQQEVLQLLKDKLSMAQNRMKQQAYQH